MPVGDKPPRPGTGGLTRGRTASRQSAMRATVNGEPIDLPEGLTVAALLERLGVRAERVAVERNGQVVKKARHGEQVVEAGDVLEIVTFVGGG
jgi:sulfur carrier protein